MIGHAAAERRNRQPFAARDLHGLAQRSGFVEAQVQQIEAVEAERRCQDQHAGEREPVKRDAPAGHGSTVN
jgi:hypothetical protein